MRIVIYYKGIKIVKNTNDKYWRKYGGINVYAHATGVRQRGQWADANYEIKGWKVVNSPRRGDVVAISANFSDATGHTAIMLSPRQSMGAAHNIVHKTDFGYSNKHFTNYPGNKGYVYRRYTGR